MNTELPHRIATLYNVFPRDGSDVEISSIYAALFPGEPPSANEQQKIGVYITRLNRRLKENRLKVVPGVARRTYRLSEMR